MTAAPTSTAAPSWDRSRWLALAEVLLATAIILGHNVWHVVPNEVPILFVLFWVSTCLRTRHSWPRSLARPVSWPRTL